MIDEDLHDGDLGSILGIFGHPDDEAYLAGALMAVDGLHFVMSRTSLLDGVLMFFVLAAFGCLVVDRDRARERLAAALPVDADGRVRPDAYVAEHTSMHRGQLADARRAAGIGKMWV